MAATIVPFAPSATAPFQFQADFDGQAYTVIVTWNLGGQRYYINIYTLQNQLVVCLPLIGSPVGYDVSLTAGYFDTQLIYRPSSGNFEII